MVVLVKRESHLQHWLNIQVSYCLLTLMVVEVRYRQRTWFVWVEIAGTALTAYEGMEWELWVDTCVVVAWVCTERKRRMRKEYEKRWNKLYSLPLHINVHDSPKNKITNAPFRPRRMSRRSLNPRGVYPSIRNHRTRGRSSQILQRRTIRRNPNPHSIHHIHGSPTRFHLFRTKNGHSSGK